MGFRASLPCVIPNPIPSRSSGNRPGVCCLDAESQGRSLSVGEGLRAATSLDPEGRHFAHSVWTYLGVTLVTWTSSPFPGYSWVSQGMHPWLGVGLV